MILTIRMTMLLCILWKYISFFSILGKWIKIFILINNKIYNARSVFESVVNMLFLIFGLFLIKLGISRVYLNVYEKVCCNSNERSVLFITALIIHNWIVILLSVLYNQTPKCDLPKCDFLPWPMKIYLC